MENGMNMNSQNNGANPGNGQGFSAGNPGMNYGQYSQGYGPNTINNRPTKNSMKIVVTILIIIAAAVVIGFFIYSSYVKKQKEMAIDTADEFMKALDNGDISAAGELCKNDDVLDDVPDYQKFAQAFEAYMMKGVGISESSLSSDSKSVNDEFEKNALDKIIDNPKIDKDSAKLSGKIVKVKAKAETLSYMDFADSLDQIDIDNEINNIIAQNYSTLFASALVNYDNDDESAVLQPILDPMYKMFAENLAASMKNAKSDSVSIELTLEKDGDEYKVSKIDSSKLSTYAKGLSETLLA